LELPLIPAIKHKHKPKTTSFMLHGVSYGPSHGSGSSGYVVSNGPAYVSVSSGYGQSKKGHSSDNVICQASA
jgi:hypothetical protein